MISQLWSSDASLILSEYKWNKSETIKLVCLNFDILSPPLTLTVAAFEKNSWLIWHLYRRFLLPPVPRWICSDGSYEMLFCNQRKKRIYPYVGSKLLELYIRKENRKFLNLIWVAFLFYYGGFEWIAREHDSCEFLIYNLSNTSFLVSLEVL